MHGSHFLMEANLFTSKGVILHIISVLSERGYVYTTK